MAERKQEQEIHITAADEDAKNAPTHPPKTLILNDLWFSHQDEAHGLFSALGALHIHIAIEDKLHNCKQ